jgi:hypothetical protein
MAIAVFTTVESLTAMFAGQRQRRQHHEPGMRRERRRGSREATGTLHPDQDHRVPPSSCHRIVPAGPTFPSGGQGMETPPTMAASNAMRLLVSVNALELFAHRVLMS